jgi:chemotaxis response regulator CheB
VGIRVLIADDHPIVGAGLVSVLTREKDIEVVGEASDGQRAIAMARERQPDVLLMDLRMALLDGIAAIEVITREQPNTRVLALTSLRCRRGYSACAEGRSTRLLAQGHAGDEPRRRRSCRASGPASHAFISRRTARGISVRARPLAT